MGRLESERKKLPEKAQQKERISNIVIGPDDTEPPKPPPSPPPPQPKPQERTVAKKRRRK